MQGAVTRRDSARRADGHRAVDRLMQEELARLSTNGSRVVAIGSTHYVQIDRGDVVIAAIRRVLDAARSTSK